MSSQAPSHGSFPSTRSMPKDGRIYDRCAIESWIKSRQRAQQPLISPWTSAPMSPHLTPAVQVRNEIKCMVESRAVTGEKADLWIARMEEEKKTEQLRLKADAGDSDAMWRLGTRLTERHRRSADAGSACGVEEALSWVRRSADLENATGMAAFAAHLLRGSGIPKDESRALVYLGGAAAKGSAQACYMLGVLHRNQSAGLTADVHEISKWFQKMATCQVRDSHERARATAAAWLAAQGLMTMGVSSDAQTSSDTHRDCSPSIHHVFSPPTTNPSPLDSAAASSSSVAHGPSPFFLPADRHRRA